MVKHCHWDDATSVGDRAPCKLEERVPKTSRSGDVSRDGQNDLKRSAYLFTLRTLWQHPEHCLTVQSFVQSLITPKVAGDTDDTFKSISTVGRLDASWLAAWIVQNLGFDKQALARAVQFDDHAMKQIIQFALAVPSSLKLPNECCNKKILSDFMLWRYVAAGRRFSGNKPKNLIGEDGRLAWASLGVYQLVWKEDGKASKVRHFPTLQEVDVPEHVVITKKFDMEANWNDMASEVSLGPSKYLLHSLFSADKGPHVVEQLTARSTLMKEKVAELKTNYDESKKAIQNDAVEEFAVTPSAKDKAEQAQKARTALVARKAATAKKRRTSLADL